MAQNQIVTEVRVDLHRRDPIVITNSKHIAAILEQRPHEQGTVQVIAGKSSLKVHVNFTSQDEGVLTLAGVVIR